MGWVEWLGESRDPRSWGSITFGRPDGDGEDVDGPSVPGVIIRFAIAAGVLGTACYLLFAHALPLTWKAVAITAAILLAYLLVAYLVRPEPEINNLGWLGGFMDDPLHYSDDISRLLLVLLIVLWPGRFAACALVDLVRLFRKCREVGALIFRKRSGRRGLGCSGIAANRTETVPFRKANAPTREKGDERVTCDDTTTIAPWTVLHFFSRLLLHAHPDAC